MNSKKAKELRRQARAIAAEKELVTVAHMVLNLPQAPGDCSRPDRVTVVHPRSLRGVYHRLKLEK